MTDKKNILIAVNFTPAQMQELQAMAPDFRVRAHTLTEGQPAPEDYWNDVEVLYTEHGLPDPQAAPDLKWIQFHYAGIDRFINEPILKKPGLLATTLSGANAPQVAEHALTLLLALGHQLPELQVDQARSQWSPDRYERYIPKELAGSTVGIVGYGHVGQRLARLLQPFEVKILASKRDLLDLASQPEGYQDEAGDPQGALVHRLYPGKAVRSMLKSCDFIVVTVPLTAETQHLLGTRLFNALKPGAILVDVSRGGVVDHKALIAALEKSQLGGAGLDVFPEEPLPADSALWEMSNVIITPHIAGVSQHYQERAFDLFKANLSRYLEGKPLFNTVDLKRGY